ncbi:2-succinyl-5-enolpyruvyl-6-hydroxy-3-cyclohexene-1-carboxylic-acid synthase [Psychromonas sp. PT13]|uniref:2-succinyl-5-enolpyruvyl-6-hydroxy-3- cyclohexene-1-carboxylic-acid synthase n=1 Tax=Psychromonas sp. PT13 TaxID=3439547 RepID=UPI003EB9C335
MDNGTAHFNQTAANINLLWSSLFIEELVRNGITDFCIAPGSRSTPLTLTVASRADIHTHVHFDERGLGFLALGIALAKKKPVVLITTSGSAVANLYPAIIEAKQSHIPLIILSADRPPELIDCGANQAINQHGIFANYPIFFQQIPSPNKQVPPNYLLTTINHGLNKQTHTPAPIHFNISFPEPLYPGNDIIDYREYLSPLKQWLTSNIPFTQYQRTPEQWCGETNQQLIGKKIIIIIGRLTTNSEVQAIAQFARDNNFPVVSDIQASLPHKANHLNYYDLLLAYPHFETALSQANVILQFGDKLISKRLTKFIGQFDGEYWLVESGEQCIDPSRNLTRRFICQATQWINTQHITAIDSSWLTSLTTYNQLIEQKFITPFIANNLLTEINVINSLAQLAQNTALFIGNSMPIRLCDMFINKNNATIYTNRGASGIDGLLATAIGVSKGKQEPMTLIIGDTSFLYDLNSLTLLKQLNRAFIIILINNDGGSIFNLLPVPEQQKREFYQLPHGLNFVHTCKQFDIDYYCPNQLNEFKANYQTATKKKLSLIEVCTKPNQTKDQLAQLIEQIKNATF